MQLGKFRCVSRSLYKTAIFPHLNGICHIYAALRGNILVVESNNEQLAYIKLSSDSHWTQVDQLWIDIYINIF